MTLPYTVYLANAMSNIPAFNFPWFFNAEDYLVEDMGWDVLSPARKDLEQIPWDVMQTIKGFDTGNLRDYVENSSFTMANAMEWDLPAINRSKGIVLGDAWAKSTGARWERTVAEALARDIWLLHGNGPEDFTLERDPEPNQMTEFMRLFPEWQSNAVLNLQG